MANTTGGTIIRIFITTLAVSAGSIAYIGTRKRKLLEKISK